jgi:hypothetical protein
LGVVVARVQVLQAGIRVKTLADPAFGVGGGGGTRLAASIGGIGKGADQQRHMVMPIGIRHAKADGYFVKE